MLSWYRPRVRGAVSLPSLAETRSFYAVNAVISVGALSAIAYLLLVRRGGPTGVDVSFLPAVNAGLNATAAGCLLCGYAAIRRGAQRVHRAFMTGALGASALFFASYLAYHYVHGDTKFTGVGPVRYVYFAVLISHVLLSMTIVPMALASFWYAFRERFVTHAKVARVLFPIWMYVSVTGVVIFLMLR